MLKLKTKKSVYKRFKITKNGKIKRNKAFANHILTKKSRNRKRRYNKSGLTVGAEAKNIKRMLPYGN